MHYRPSTPWKVLLVLLSFSAVTSCETKKHKKHKKKAEQETAATQLPAVTDDNPAIDCDTRVWRHVYNPSRLTVRDSCKTVTGVIEESSADEDGDQHMLLKLDAGQTGLLTEKNSQKKQGDLVIEAVCVNNTTLGKVGNACQGYVNKIQLPAVGAHVKVSGSYVIDSHNGWAEIHPITALAILR